MILKFVYHTKGYYGADTFFVADFDKKTICESDKKADVVVDLIKQSGVKILENQLVRDFGFTVVEI